MRFILLLSLLFSSASFAAFDLNSQCHKIKDKLDRDYCHGKRMKIFRSELNKDKNSWKKSLTAKVKKDKTNKVQTDIAQREAQLKMLNDELKILKGHKAELAKTDIVKPKKKRKKKKKEDKNDLNKALKKLGIKL